MKSDWESDLSALRDAQRELREQMAGIEKRIADLQQQFASSERSDEKEAKGVDEPARPQSPPPLPSSKPSLERSAIPAKKLPPKAGTPPSVQHAWEESASKSGEEDRDPASGSSTTVTGTESVAGEMGADVAQDTPEVRIPNEAKSETLAPSPVAAENLELRVGKYWLVRVGILVLLTGLVLLGNLAYQTFVVSLGAAGKLSLLCLAGALLVGTGLFLERRLAGMRNYGRVLLAGGVATLYYSTFAATFVSPLRVINSPLLGGVLLLIFAVGLVGLASWRRSQGVAFTSILLSYYTSVINPVADFSVYSNLLLTAAAVFLLVRHRWFGVSWLSLVGTYGSFAYWQWFLRPGLLGDGGGSIWVSLAFVLAYWIIFTVALFCREASTFRSTHRVVFLTSNNLAFFVLATPALLRWHPQEFWLFPVIFGAVLLGLAALAWRTKKEEASFDGAYLAQGLLLLTLGLAAKFSGYDRAMIMIFESVALLFSSRYRHRLLYQIASFLTGAWAFFLAMETLSKSTPSAWVLGSLVAFLLVANGWQMKHISQSFHPPRWEWGTAVFVAAGLLLSAVVLANRFDGPSLVWALALAALGGTLSLRMHRLPELAILSLGFLVVMLGSLFVAYLDTGVAWRSGLPALGAALFLMHWWQRQKSFEPSLRQVLEGGVALVFCAVALLWLAPSGEEREMLELVALGLGILVYGLATKAWFLAAMSQIFTVFGTFLCLRAMLEGEPPWALTLATIFVIALQAASRRVIPETARVGLTPVFLFYRGLTAILGLCWILETVPAPLRFAVLVLLGAVIFVPAAMKQNREYLIYSALLTGLGLLFFWWGVLGNTRVSGYDFLGLLVLLGLQPLAKSLLGRSGYWPSNAQAAVSIVAILGLWLQSSRLVWEQDLVLAVTVVWALLAFALLGFGFLIRERVWRLMGLLILAISVGHVFLVDVWKMGQFAGILGIIGLALILLVLGFIYNRFAGEIKKWI